MRLLKTVFFLNCSQYTPTRGHMLKDKWENIISRQNHYNKSFQYWKECFPEEVKVPIVEAFRNYIKQNPLINMYLKAGLDSIPETVQQFQYQDSKTIPVKPRPGVCHGYCPDQLLDALAAICVTPPRFQDADIIGVPFLALLIDLLNTEHGRTFFSIPEVNAFLKEIFDTYGRMLDSPFSLKHMNGEEGGWLSPAALQRVSYQDFICDPSAPHFGFKSWHDWFTREIREEARSFGNNENEIINNSESFPYAKPSENVQWKDKFWLKDQRYSLGEMLNAEAFPLSEQMRLRDSFEGGTVYQGFLNPWCYHRWRSPISGVIEKCYRAGYSYYVGNPSLSPSLKEGYIASQPLLSMISARQIYIIKADNPKIGRICVIEIGMAEVSGIKNLVQEGQRVSKGDLLGYFRFGGSSHAIIFDRNASNLRFNPSIHERILNPSTNTHEFTLQKVRSPLAWVS